MCHFQICNILSITPTSLGCLVKWKGLLWLQLKVFDKICNWWARGTPKSAGLIIKNLVHFYTIPTNDLSSIHSDKEQGVISKTLCDKIDGSTKYCYKGQNTLPSLLVVYFRQQRELKKGRIEKSLRNIKRDSYTLLKIDKQYQTEKIMNLLNILSTKYIII